MRSVPDCGGLPVAPIPGVWPLRRLLWLRALPDSAGAWWRIVYRIELQARLIRVNNPDISPGWLNFTGTFHWLKCYGFLNEGESDHWSNCRALSVTLSALRLRRTRHSDNRIYQGLPVKLCLVFITAHKKSITGNPLQRESLWKVWCLRKNLSGRRPETVRWGFTNWQRSLHYLRWLYWGVHQQSIRNNRWINDSWRTLQGSR